jgi:hypothetical protein
MEESLFLETGCPGRYFCWLIFAGIAIAAAIGGGVVFGGKTGIRGFFKNMIFTRPFIRQLIFWFPNSIPNFIPQLLGTSFDRPPFDQLFSGVDAAPCRRL